MVPNKQNLEINFHMGLDTKTDPWQLSAENLLVLQNSVFTTGGRITKRNGYQSLAALPNTSSVYLTTLNDNLTAIGDNIYAYNESDSSWLTKGTIQPMEINTLPLIRNNLNQTQCDAAISNGIVCTVYSELNNVTTTYKYAIADSITGQNIIAPTIIASVTGSPRVFVLGNFFVIVYTVTDALYYIAVSILNPSTVTTPAVIASSYVPAPTLSWDGVVAGQQLFIAYSTTSGGQSVSVTYLTAASAAIGGLPATPNSSTGAGYYASIMSLCADTSSTTRSPVIWVNFYYLTGTVGYTFAVDQNLGTLVSPVETIASGTVLNLASAATGGNPNSSCALYAEVAHNYSYDSSIPTNYIQPFFISQPADASVVGTPVRSIGLASKAFIVDNTVYFLAAYQSPYQPTYFLMEGSQSSSVAPIVVGKLAYENGGGYLTTGLPSVTVVNSDNAYVAYLYKDLIAAVKKGTALPSGTQTAGVYSQTGINLASFTIGTQNIDTAEIGANLLISGGFLWSYDGYLPVESNFFLYPDSVEPSPNSSGGGLAPGTYYYQVTYEWTDNQGNAYRSAPSIPVSIVVGSGSLTFHSVFSSGVSSITVSSASGLFIGQVITDSTTSGNITTGTYIISISGTTVGLSQPTAGASTTTPGDALNTIDTFKVVLDIPTLRLTYKTANPVKIVIYRWSTNQPVYYQVTSIIAPILNSLTIDSVSYNDTSNDMTILGNNIIYTNGGVVEDINGPASNIFTLFDTRFWLVDAEDQNLLWFSKQVIENTPVEMSDLFTFYIAPTTASQGSTGPITALAPMDDKLIIFKANAIYYINGAGPDNTGSNNQYSQPIFITSTVGCMNQQSIVFQPAGLMFQSEKGIWLLGRDLSTSYIGAGVEAFNSSIVQSAVNVPETNQVRFTLNTGQTLMYDYYYQQWGTFVGVPAISSCIYQNLHSFLNSYGAVYQENPGSYVDGSNPVLLSLTSAWLNLAGLQGYQSAFFFFLLGEYYTPFKLQCSIAYDYNPAVYQTSLIEPTNYTPVFGGDGSDEENPFGQQHAYGGPSSLLDWRVFLNKHRCSSIQITLQEVYDSSFGVPAGQGLTLSGINLIYGTRNRFRPHAAVHSIGGANS